MRSLNWSRLLDESARRRGNLPGWQSDGLPEAVRHRAKDLERDVALLVEHIAELLVAEDQAVHRRRRRDRSRAGTVVEQGDLAEELAWSEHVFSRRRLDLRLAVQDHEEIAARLALPAEHLPRGKVHLVDARHDETKLVIAAAGKERYRTKSRDPLICHSLVSLSGLCDALARRVHLVDERRAHPIGELALVIGVENDHVGSPARDERAGPAAPAERVRGVDRRGDDRLVWC